MLTVIAHLTSVQMVGLIAIAAVLVILVAQGLFVVVVLRRHGSLLLRLESLEARLASGAGPIPAFPRPTANSVVAGLPIGVSAPAFQLAKLLGGGEITLGTLRGRGKPVVLIFSDPNCGPCTALATEVARWQQEYSKTLTVTVISRGSIEVNRRHASKHGLQDVLLQKDREVAESYQAHGTPSAVLVRPDGTIGSLVMAGSQAISDLIVRVTNVAIPAHPSAENSHPRATHATSLPREGPPIGEAAPSFALPDLSGQPVELAHFKGRDTVMLFWNPGCGFCQQMLPDLKTWEENRPPDAPELMVISAGTVEANRAMAFRSTVVLDQNFNTGRAFGAHGTPSAVLIDAKGDIASPAMAGAPAVMKLVSRRAL